MAGPWSKLLAARDLVVKGGDLVKDLLRLPRGLVRMHAWLELEQPFELLEFLVLVRTSPSAYESDPVQKLHVELCFWNSEQQK